MLLNSDILQETFLQLLTRHGVTATLAQQWWTEILKHYTSKKRHYHTLTHLQQLLQQLMQVKEQINDWDTVLFALYYHDIIYNTLKQNNEEKSAALAAEKLIAIRYPADKIAVCIAAIRATKAHQQHALNDINLFTDADLCILGASAEAYTIYYKAIRQEYSIYPDFMYNKGRKKVLQHFIEMERIFKTPHFYNLYETQAKENLQKELETLH